MIFLNMSLKFSYLLFIFGISPKARVQTIKKRGLITSSTLSIGIGNNHAHIYE